MAIQLIWWEDGETLEYRCSGVVTGEELIARNVEALADARFPRIRRQLCDLSATSDFRIDSDQVRRIVAIDFDAKELAPAMERIALVTEADLVRGFARMYEIMLDGRIPTWEVEVLPTRDDALEWFGVDGGA